MKKNWTIMAAVLMLLACLFGCSKQVINEDYESQNWDAKEIQYQLYDFDPSAVGTKDFNFPQFGAVMNLYSDGYLSIWEIPKVAIGATTYENKEDHISYYYHGYWKQDGNRITVYYCSREYTALSKDSLSDLEGDGYENGYVKVTYTVQADGTLDKEAGVDGVAYLLVRDTQVTNASIEYLLFKSYGKVYYPTTKDFYEAVKSYLTSLSL